MNKSKMAQRISLLALGWLLTYPIILQLNLTSATASPTKFKLPPAPPRGIAGKRAAAASRDGCPQVDRPLTALVPEYRPNKAQNPGLPTSQVWGLTTMERPTFWFYVPYAPPALIDAAFTLKDESNVADPQVVYQSTQLLPTQTPGLMRVVLPKSSTPLATNKPYHWYLTLNMGCTKGQRPIFVEGWIQRTEMNANLQERMKQSSPSEQVTLAAENSFWYDALTTLGNLRATKPQDPALRQEWQTLLESIELGSLASEPFGSRLRSNSALKFKQTGF